MKWPLLAAALIALQATVVCAVIATDDAPSLWWCLVPILACVGGLASLAMWARSRFAPPHY